MTETPLMCCAGVTRTTCLLAIVLAFIAPGLAQDHSDRPLTNSDVVKMVNAGIPESVIVRDIEVSGTNFVITADALISLKQHHVPGSVLAAIVDSQAASKMRQAGPPAMAYAAAQSASHPHRQLPNVDATLRLDSKTTGRVQVRKNEIKVEKAGVPLFSVKWKENSAK
jgi:hypothetical protein